MSKSGALTLQLDGERLLDLEGLGSRDEYYHLEVDLEAGRHSLLAKVSGETEPPELACSLSQPDGEAPSGVSCAPLVPGELVKHPVHFRMRPLPMVQELEERAEADTLNAALAYWRLVSLALFDLEDDVRDYDWDAMARYPRSAVMEHAVGYTLDHAGNSDAARFHMRKAASWDPSNAQVVLWQASELMRRELYTQADSLLQELTLQSPDFVKAQILLLYSYEKRDMVEETTTWARKLLERHPEYPGPARVLARYHDALDPSRARKCRETAIENSPHSAALVGLYLQALQKDDVGKLAKRLKKLAELFPDSPNIQTEYVAAKLREGDNDAIELSERLASLFPYSAAAQRLRARVAELLMPRERYRRQEAMSRYRRVLELDPGDFDVRDKWRRFQGLKPVREILPAMDLEAARAKAVEAADYPGSGACVLMDERRRIVFMDGSTYSERGLVIKILTEEGVERFSNMHTGVNPLFSDLKVYSARTLKPDGRDLEAAVLLGEVAFRDVAPGDLIELHHGSSSWSMGTLNEKFWDAHLFQWNVPCLLSRYVILIPPDQEFEWTLHNDPEGSVLVASRAYDDLRLSAWTLKDVPAREWELHAPPSRDVSPWLDVSTVSSWDEIGEWYADLSDVPSRPDPRIHEKNQELLDEEDDLAERVSKLYDFVNNDVSYENLSFQYSAFVPERARDVLSAKYGDCKDQVCLLRSMLADAGVESYFALVSPVTEGTTPFLPSPRFSHAILAVPVDEGFWFLDPTAKGTPSSFVPGILQGAQALVVGRGAAASVSIPYQPYEAPHFQASTDVTIESREDMRIVRREVFRQGDDISVLRDLLAQSDEKKQTNVLTLLLSASLVGPQVSSCEWLGVEPGVDSLVVRYEVLVENALNPSGNMSVTKLPWRSRIDERFSFVVASAQRQEPLELHGLRLYEVEELRLKIPAGWRIEGSPDPREIETPYGSFSVHYELEGGELRARRSVRISGERVPPSEYPEFKGFVENVLREQDMVLILRTAG